MTVAILLSYTKNNKLFMNTGNCCNKINLKILKTNNV